VASTFAGRLVNSGTLNVAPGGTVTFLGATSNAGRINFAGAGTFTTTGGMTNTGILNAQNNLTGNVVAVGGNYTGGGQFFADYSDVTVTADHLNIAGTASGNTNVALNRVGPLTYVPGGFVPVVTVAAGAAPGVFTSNTAFPTAGFLLESFGQNPSSNKQFGVIQTINPRATSIGSLARVGEAVSATLDEPIAPYVPTLAGAGSDQRHFGLWIRGSAGYTKEKLSTSITGAGIAQSAVDRLVTDDKSLQVGADFGTAIGAAWNLHVGVFGGCFEANAHLIGNQRVDLTAPFLGAYAAVDNGAFALEGAIRHEWRKYDLRLPSLFGSAAEQSVDGSATVGSVRASYRIGGPRGFAATPMAGFSYGDNDIDDLAIGANSVYSPANYKTKVGQAGLRVSYVAETGSGVVIEPFAAAALRHNWSHFDRGIFSFGTPPATFALETVSWRSAVRYSAGVTAHDRSGRMSFFVLGTVDDGSRLDAARLTAGARVNF
jgi:outer membrane autotransporter protein